MKENVNAVARIQHIALGDIITLEAAQNGQAIFAFTKAFDIPFVRAGVSFSFNKAESQPGKTWTVNLGGNLKSELPRLKLGVLLLTLESKEQIIIGQKELPVKDLSAPESLFSKQIQVVHKSWHKPYKIAL